MILFAPDLVIISAGFDAHDEDPLANVELLDEDFQWATEVVMQACVTINPDKPIPGKLDSVCYPHLDHRLIHTHASEINSTYAQFHHSVSPLACNILIHKR